MLLSHNFLIGYGPRCLTLPSTHIIHCCTASPKPYQPSQKPSSNSINTHPPFSDTQHFPHIHFWSCATVVSVLVQSSGYCGSESHLVVVQICSTSLHTVLYLPSNFGALLSISWGLTRHFYFHNTVSVVSLDLNCLA